MSARPDLCGGYRATGIPTAIANGGMPRRIWHGGWMLR